MFSAFFPTPQTYLTPIRNDEYGNEVEKIHYNSDGSIRFKEVTGKFYRVHDRISSKEESRIMIPS
jgi:hypothetical protein